MSSTLPVATLVWQPRPSTYWVTVVSKLTFVIRPQELGLADEQEPIVFQDAFWNDDSNRSLAATADLIPSKARCDVVVVGQAYAPAGKPVRSLVVRIGFETIDKSMELVMDRSIGADGTIYQGQRFARLPMSYERTASGPQNPVGVRHGARDSYGRSPLPNIVPVGKGEDMAGPFEPIGFGPIAPHWPQRSRVLPVGRSPQKLLAEPMPENFDFSFFNMAPLDQQCEELPLNGALLLENLHCDHPIVGATLPGLEPRVTVERRGGSERPKLRADTLLVDSDRGLVTLTFRGHFPIEHPSEKFRVLAELDKSHESWRTMQHEVTEGAPEGRGAAAPPPEGRGRETLVDGIERAPPLERSQEKTQMPGLAAAGLPFSSAARRSGLPFGDRRKSQAPSTPPEPEWPSSGPATAILTSPVAAQIAAATAFPGSFPAPNLQPPTFAPASPPAATPTSQNEVKTVPPPAPPQLAPGPMAQMAPPMPAPAMAPAVTGAPAMQVRSIPSSGLAGMGPVVPPQHASAAALTGLVGASNAAADPRRPDVIAAPRVIEGDVLHLLWFHPEVAPRVRRRAEWKKLLDKLEQGRFDPDVDEGALSEDPADMEDRREVYEVIARGTPTGNDSIDRALLDAVRSDGRFAPQLLLLVGEVRFDFDEIEQLKATIATALPFANTDEAMKKQIESATTFLGAPGLVASPEVASAMSGRIREAFINSERVVGPTFLDDQVERALLDRRSFQKRNVFGDPHLRGEFLFAGNSTGIPIYLPDAVAKKLPLFRRLRMRTLAEAHFQADQYESHAAALKAVAVARIVR